MQEVEMVEEVGWFGALQSNLKPPSMRGALKVSKSTGHTQKCHVRHQEHQNRTNGARISQNRFSKEDY